MLYTQDSQVFDKDGDISNRTVTCNFKILMSEKKEMLFLLGLWSIVYYILLLCYLTFIGCLTLAFPLKHKKWLSNDGSTRQASAGTKWGRYAPPRSGPVYTVEIMFEREKKSTNLWSHNEWMWLEELATFKGLN